MSDNRIRIFIIAFFVISGVLACIGSAPAQDTEEKWSPAIPKTWDDEAIRSLEVPLADPKAFAKHISADYYYRIPVRPIYKSYPEG